MRTLAAAGLETPHVEPEHMVVRRDAEDTRIELDFTPRFAAVGLVYRKFHDTRDA